MGAASIVPKHLPLRGSMKATSDEKSNRGATLRALETDNPKTPRHGIFIATSWWRVERVAQVASLDRPNIYQIVCSAL